MSAHRVPLHDHRPVLPWLPAAATQLAREVLIVAGAMVAYFGIRNLTAGGADAAIRNAARVERLERWLGMAWEHGLQSLVVGSKTLVTLANWIYIWGHWPVVLSAAVVLFLTRRPRYRLLRDAIVLSGIIGFVLFALLPVAPPRLADPTFVDTVTLHSHAYRTLQPPGLTNQFAALPSLHVGWNLLVGIALWQAFHARVVRVFAVVMPAAMAAAVVVTANHWVLDVVSGVMVVLFAQWLAGVAGRRASATALASDAWRGR